MEPLSPSVILVQFKERIWKMERRNHHRENIIYVHRQGKYRLETLWQ